MTPQDKRFHYAIYYALRDMDPELREEVIAAAHHAASWPDCVAPCRFCAEETVELDWWPDEEDQSRFPYAPLLHDWTKVTACDDETLEEVRALARSNAELIALLQARVERGFQEQAMKDDPVP